MRMRTRLLVIIIGDNTMGALIMCFKLVPKMVAEADTRIQNVEEIKPGGV